MASWQQNVGWRWGWDAGLLQVGEIKDNGESRGGDEGGMRVQGDLETPEVYV